MRIKSYYEKQIYDKLYEKYGPTPPIECVARVMQELSVMRKKPFFRDLELIRAIREIGTREGVPVFMESFYGSSFLAWLLSASRINPLPSHRYCPHCHRTEFFSNVEDGWDLSPEFCCGEPVLVDGHNVPFDSIANDMPANGFNMSFQISDNLLGECINYVLDFYEGTGTRLVPFRTEMSELDESVEVELAVIPEEEPLPELDSNGVWHADLRELYEKGYQTIRFRSSPVLNEISSLVGQTQRRPDLEAKPNNNTLLAVYDELLPEYSYNKEIALSEKVLTFTTFLKLFSFPHGVHDWGPEEIALFQKHGAHLEDLFTCREDVTNEILSRSNLYHADGRYFAYYVMEKARKGIYRHDGVPAEIARLLQSIGVPDYLIAQMVKTGYLPSKNNMIEQLMNRCILEEYRNISELYPKAAMSR